MPDAIPPMLSGPDRCRGWAFELKYDEFDGFAILIGALIRIGVPVGLIARECVGFVRGGLEWMASVASGEPAEGCKTVVGAVDLRGACARLQGKASVRQSA